MGMRVTQQGAELLAEMEPLIKELFGLTELEEILRRRLGLRRVIIITGDADQSEWVKKEMGRAGARLLREEAHPGQVVAVAGGTTVAAVAEMMAPTPALKETTFVPARGGLGEALTDEQARHIQDLLDRHNPEELQIASPLWTRRAVCELIHRQCHLRLAVRTVGEYLRRWGYTPKKPRRHARQQDPEEVRLWLEETYPAIERRAAAEGATIYWCDETGVAADEHPGRGYARQGQPAQMEVPKQHIHMNQVSAISNAGEVRFMTYGGTMNAALFIVFLGRLLRSTTGKIYLIVDRLRAHEKAEAEWVAAHQERLEVFYLPRRAPELNPDEYLNNEVKGGVNAEGLPNDKRQLRSRLQAFMQRLVHLPEHVKNFFQHPCVQYAAT